MIPDKFEAFGLKSDCSITQECELPATFFCFGPRTLGRTDGRLGWEQGSGQTVGWFDDRRTELHATTRALRQGQLGECGGEVPQVVAFGLAGLHLNVVRTNVEMGKAEGKPPT